MKNWIFLILTLLLMMDAVAFGQTTSHQQFKAKHHIILVLDGPRWSETWGDSTHRLIPNQANRLKQEGVFFTNFRNNGVTLTNSGHGALITGVYQRLPNNGSKEPKNPSIFNYYLKQSNADKRKAWVMTSKGKLQMLANTTNKKWWNTYTPSVYSGINGSGTGYPSDRLLYPTFKALLLEHQPVVTLINLIDIDAWAHQGNWEKYTGAIQELDGFVLDLWKTIQSNPALKDQTALYITNDHGRHLDGVKSGFESHGCGCEGCRHISLLAIGPDFEKGKVVDVEREMIDVPATIAYMLNIDMPTLKGKAIKELFK